MNLKIRVKSLFLSWDFAAAAATTLTVALCSPRQVPNDLAKDYYGIGISVLSIVFSVFFAALAVIITASDDEFVAFLEAEGDYSALLSNFKISLELLFWALVYSLALYAYTAARISRSVKFQRSPFLIIFSFLFLWGLFAAFYSAYDAIRYADYRKKFLEARRKAGS